MPDNVIGQEPEVLGLLTWAKFSRRMTINRLTNNWPATNWMATRTCGEVTAARSLR